MINKLFIQKIIFFIQKILLFFSYKVCAAFIRKKEGLWIIGVCEIANYLNLLARIIKPSISVNLCCNKFFDKDNIYNVSLSRFPFLVRILFKILWSPILFGYLINRSDSFLYIGSEGFLINSVDGREYEFKLLKLYKKKLVTLFCGSDIRSIQLSLDYAKKLDLEVIASYYGLCIPECLEARYETKIKRLASSADRYADLIFNAPVDQISYLQRQVEPIFYTYPDDQFYKDEKKFISLSKIIVTHIPSSPIIKGTQVIRSAVKKLKVMGYLFEYIELINIPNSVVIEQLRQSHIAINELYAFVPGVFGIEAMASHCALITSADCKIETSLPENGNEAWMVTRSWEIFDNLKYLLDNPELIKTYADKGFEWTFKNYRETVIQRSVNKLINSI